MKLFETEKTGWTIIQQGTLFQPKAETGSPLSTYCITDIDFGSDNKPVVTSVPLNSDGFSSALTGICEVCHIQKVVGQMDAPEVKKQFIDVYKLENNQYPPEELIERIDASSKKAPHVVFIGE